MNLLYNYLGLFCFDMMGYLIWDVGLIVYLILDLGWWLGLLVFVVVDCVNWLLVYFVFVINDLLRMEFVFVVGVV